MVELNAALAACHGRALEADRRVLELQELVEACQGRAMQAEQRNAELVALLESCRGCVVDLERAKAAVEREVLELKEVADENGEQLRVQSRNLVLLQVCLDQFAAFM